MLNKVTRSSVLRRRLAENSVQLLIGRMALFAFGYPIAIILARELGPAHYGVYGILLSVLVAVMAFIAPLIVLTGPWLLLKYGFCSGSIAASRHYYVKWAGMI